MIADIKTIMWKDSKGLLRRGDNRARTIFTLLTPVVLFGVVFPIQFRDEWLFTGWSIVIAIITPFILISMAIPESFAGERERHTLETLLASRLPDRAIFFGKLLNAIVYGYGMTLLLLLISLVVYNLVQWTGQFQIFELKILLADISVGLLMSGMVASLGILISLRAPTVQSAQQTLMAVLLFPLLLVQVAGFLLPTLLPKETVRDFLQGIDYLQILYISLAFLLVANVGFLLIGMKRFTRAKLSLD